MSDTTVQPPGAEPTGADEVGHTHADVSGGWLRAATFGAMDGLVTNISLVAGVGAAGASAHTIVLTGMAGLVAGAFSMALGEYASVTTSNEQIDNESRKEMAEIRDHPEAEARELAAMFTDMGMTPDTAQRAAEEVHGDPERALTLHVTQELGVDPNEKPSPIVAAVSSFFMFSVGALIPLLPYFFGAQGLLVGLLVGAVGLLVVGAAAAHYTVKPWWQGALRQLLFGGIAAGATYLVGLWIGVGAA